MDYKIGELAKLAHTTVRTLRHYDRIGLLSPREIQENGYRIYGQQEVDTLQQILFYKALSIPLEEIKTLLAAPADKETLLLGHLQQLEKKKREIERLIASVKENIKAEKGEITLSNKEKFKAFQRELVEKNEEKFGKEMRAAYGNEEVDASHKKILNMDEQTYNQMKQLEEEILITLAQAMEAGDAGGELAKTLFEMHKKWLMYSWGSYTKEKHIGLAMVYTGDPSFVEYYEKAGKGAAKFLQNCICNFAQ